MTEILFTSIGVVWFILFFHSINQLGKTYDEKLTLRFAYSKKLNSFGDN